MAELLICETLKLRRGRLFQIAAATAIVFPLIFALFMVQENDTFANEMTVCYQFTGYLVQIPLLCVLAAQLFFSEQDSGALKNLLVIPVPRGALVGAKLLLLLVFSVCYSLAGYAVTAVVSLALSLPMEEMGLHLLLSLGTGALFFAAAMPCMTLVVWLNKSYIISVIVTFFYTIASNLCVFMISVPMQPVGLNADTLLPLAMIQRWIYQFFSVKGEESVAFYEAFRPGFVSTPVCFGVLGAEAMLCVALMMLSCRRQEV